MDGLFDLGPDSVRRFFATWYGPPDRAGAIPAGAERLPRPLQAWYEAASRYSAPVTLHNTILDPDEIEEVDGKLVFWRENQEIYEWAADPNDDDPLVYERATVDGEPWYPAGVRLPMPGPTVGAQLYAGEGLLALSDLTATPSGPHTVDQVVGLPRLGTTTLRRSMVTTMTVRLPAPKRMTADVHAGSSPGRAGPRTQLNNIVCRYTLAACSGTR